MAEKELGTTYTLLGGNNSNRIGASCSIIEHKFKKGVPLTRIMVDMGAMLVPEGSDVDLAFPDVRKYLGTKTAYPEERLDAIFITHIHEDHIGAYAKLALAGYTFPPTYGSKETLEGFKMLLKDAGVELNADDWKDKFVEVKAGEPVNIRGVEIEAVDMSHPAVGSMGYHFLTKIDGKDVAGIFHTGDYNLRKVKLGRGFDRSAVEDLAKRKLTSHIILDSTSTGSDDKYNITYDEAVHNIVELMKKYNDKQFIVPVISGSMENAAPWLEAARIMGRKVDIGGYRQKLIYTSLQNAGIKEFDDVIIKGDGNEFVSKFKLHERLFLISGAMAEEHSGLAKLAQQEKVKPCSNNKNKKKNKKSGHPYITIGDNDSVLALPQRGIEEISYYKLKQHANQTAQLGAIVVVTASELSLGDYETVRLQSSGHANSNQTSELISIFANAKERPGDLTCIPTHGNYEQLMNTAHIAREVGLSVFFCLNNDSIKFDNNAYEKTVKDCKLPKTPWLGVKEINDNTQRDRVYLICQIGKDYENIGTLKTITTPPPKNSWKAINKDCSNKEANNQKYNKKTNRASNPYYDKKSSFTR